MAVVQIEQSLVKYLSLAFMSLASNTFEQRARFHIDNSDNGKC